MNYDDLSLKEIQKEWHGSLHSYVIGFIGCLATTGLSFFLVVFNFIFFQKTIYIIAALAIFQAIIQLLFFLHLGQEDKPKWESLVFYFMIMVLLIITIGSLWIMSDLHTRVMPNTLMDMLTHD